MGLTVAAIFSERPTHWGLRGDSYLWGELEDYFADVPLPYQPKELEGEIYAFVLKKTGNNLETTDELHVPEYHYYGMSAGMISGEFWIEQGIPLLISRLEALNIKTPKPNNGV